LPPQSVAAPAAAADADPVPDVLEDGVAALLSLPHAVSVRAATAAADSAIPSGLPTPVPKRLNFTDPTFG
jgi:hypothetical protein